jgi:hypothetical protein
MRQEDGDPFDIQNLRLSPDQIRVVTPRKITRRREHFIRVPFGWLERLNGASGKVYALALHLLYLHWKGRGQPIKLANGMLKIDGISRAAKWRALAELERRGLVSVERRSKRSPLVSVSDLKQ